MKILAFLTQAKVQPPPEAGTTCGNAAGEEGAKSSFNDWPEKNLPHVKPEP